MKLLDIYKFDIYVEVISKFLNTKDHTHLKKLVHNYIMNKDVYDAYDDLLTYIGNNVDTDYLTLYSIIDMAELGYKEAYANGNIQNEMDSYSYALLAKHEPFFKSELNVVLYGNVEL